MRAGVLAGTWVLVAGLAALLAARVVAWDSRSLLVGWNALGLVPYLVIAPIAAVAAARQRWSLVAAAVVVLGVALLHAAPQLAAREQARPIGDRMDLVTWNLEFGRAAPAVVRLVEQRRPDVLLLQEVTPDSLPVLNPVLETYPYRWIDARPDAFGSVIASRFALEDPRTIDIVGLPMAAATVDTPAGRFGIVNVHTLSPLGAGRPTWTRQIRGLAQLVRSRQQPMLLAGDFNADWGNRAFRALLSAGLTDAAAARGQLWSPTWPGDSAFGPVLRLDHVVTTSELTVVELRRGPAGGDHRSLWATIAKRR